MTEPWADNEGFLASLEVTAGALLISPDRAWILWQLAAQVHGGAIFEIGSYKGGSARLISDASGRRVFMFDTFAGMPAVDPERDTHKEGDFADVDIEAVQALNPTNVLVQGRYPDTHFDTPLSLVHIDADIYQSVRDALERTYPLLAPGGVILVDDYGFESCPGAKLAVDEFKEGKRLRLATGQMVIWR